MTILKLLGKENMMGQEKHNKSGFISRKNSGKMKIHGIRCVLLLCHSGGTSLNTTWI
jgi:hypothetical protein